MLKKVKGLMVLAVIGGGFAVRETTATDDQGRIVEGANVITEDLVAYTSFEDVKAPKVDVKESVLGSDVTIEVESEKEEEIIEGEDISSLPATSSNVSGGTNEAAASDQVKETVQAEQSVQTERNTSAVQAVQPAKKEEVKAESKPAQSSNNSNEQAKRDAEAKRQAEQKAQAEAQRQAEQEAKRQAEAKAQAEKAAAQKAAEEAAKKAAEEAAKPKFAPNSVFVNGQKVAANVNGRVVTGISSAVLSAGKVMVSDANGHGTEVTIGSAFEVTPEDVRYDNGQDVSLTLKGGNGFVFIQTLNEYARRVAQGF